ncbi:MAG: recF/RecN/SMC terminal domain protein, partial [Verrucomicrobiaceae bacterium]|nr:recF/RecN/SMC terminal domain protein [Verrucomicrobiaceae bacterium]
MLIPPKGAGFYTSIRLNREDVPGFDEYPFKIPALRHLTDLPLHPCVTFLIGENGTGKSTLVEAVAVKLGFNAEGGTKNFRFSSRASHSELYHALTVPKAKYPGDGFFLRAESFYNVATEIENVSSLHNYGGVSFHEMSHGESFFALMESRLTGDGFYIFD